MEKKQAGVCDKLFHALNFKPALQPLRRLTFRHQDPVHSTNSSPPLLAHSSNADKKHSASAAKPHGAHAVAAGKKMHEATANLKADLKHAQDLMASKVPAPRAEAPAPAPPHKVTQQPKKDLNQKMDDFITRTYGKIRTTSGVGKAPSK